MIFKATFLLKSFKKTYHLIVQEACAWQTREKSSLFHLLPNAVTRGAISTLVCLNNVKWGVGLKLGNKWNVRIKWVRENEWLEFKMGRKSFDLDICQTLPYWNKNFEVEALCIDRRPARISHPSSSCQVIGRG